MFKCVIKCFYQMFLHCSPLSLLISHLTIDFFGNYSIWWLTVLNVSWRWLKWSLLSGDAHYPAIQSFRSKSFFWWHITNKKWIAINMSHRSCRPEVFCKNVFLINSAKFNSGLELYVKRDSVSGLSIFIFCKQAFTIVATYTALSAG